MLTTSATESDPDPVRLAIWKACLYSLALTFIYVGVLYIKRSTRPSADVKRDDPSVVKARLTVISIASAVSVLVLVPAVLLLEGVYSTWSEAWASLRIFWGWKLGQGGDGPLLLDIVGLLALLALDVLKALLLTSVLFIGPLLDFLYFAYQEKSYTLGYGPTYATLRTVTRDVKAGLSDIYGIRNYVVGPLTEELVFRAGVLALFLASPVSESFLVFATPLFFGVGHLHHAWELVVDDVDYPPRYIVFRTLFQFAFTTIFGWYAAFLFLRFGSVWPCAAVHVYCNALGPPSFGHVGKNMAQTWVYRALLVAGLAGFSLLLVPLTSSANKIL